MFFGRDNGGRTAAVRGRLVACSKRLHIDAFAYLRDASARISTHPHPRLEELLPDRPAAARTTQSS